MLRYCLTTLWRIPLVEIFRTSCFLSPEAFVDTWSGSFPRFGWSIFKAFCSLKSQLGHPVALHHDTRLARQVDRDGVQSRRSPYEFYKELVNAISETAIRFLAVSVEAVDSVTSNKRERRHAQGSGVKPRNCRL